jgi:sugar lactone lactonase YvrE
MRDKIVRGLSVLLIASLPAAFGQITQPLYPGQSEVLLAPRATTAQPLLFTFAANTFGFDTEFAIANTTVDPFASTQTSGTCTISFYGTGTPTPSTSVALPGGTITAGTSRTFQLSSMAPGFQGYAIVSCTFPMARGSARITYNAGQQNGVIMEEQAQIVTLPRSVPATSHFLIPFVSNQLGFDAGIAFANSSADPFGTSQTSATCTLSFYGVGAPAPSSGVAVPGGAISPGTSRAFTLSSVAPGFQGYIMADCTGGVETVFVYEEYSLTQNNGFSFSVTPEAIVLPRVSTPAPLLFSAVSNQNGDDTGIAIANTSADPYGANGVTPGNGTCVLSFFGSGAPGSNFTTPTINAGTVYATVVSAIAPGFKGYVTANCQFGAARGFSFVTGNVRANAYSALPEVIQLPRSSSQPSTILFSDVTSQFGADTKIDISNTSLDQLGTTAGSGTCLISYYGANAPAAQTSASIAAGSQLSFSLAHGNAADITGTPGFRGYLIASCNFPLARGTAEFKPAPIVLPAYLPAAGLGASYSASLTGLNGVAPYSNWALSAGALPPGLVLSTNGGITGTPNTTAGSPFTFTVSMQDSAGNVSLSRTLSLAVAPFSISSLTPNTASAGSGPIGVNIAGSALTGAAKVAWTGPTGASTILPSSITAGQMSVTIPAALLNTVGTAQIAVSDSTGTVLSNQLPFVITAALPALTITTPPALPGGLQGTAYSTTLAATGGSGSYTWSATGLPAWLTLSPAGLLSGTPPNELPVTLAATVTSGSLVASQTFTAAFNQQAGTHNYQINTIVGQARPSGVPGPNTFLQAPQGLAMDSTGNLYEVEVDSRIVRRINAGNTSITTVAGAYGQFPAVGFGGPALAASFNAARYVAIDTAGNLFIADQGSCTVDRVDAVTHLVTIYAGQTGVCGFAGDNGLATSAQLSSFIRGVAVDSTGALFIAEPQNLRVRRVDPVTGIITTYAGNGNSFTTANVAANSTGVGNAFALAFDPSGNLFIGGANRIFRVDKTTNILTVYAGTGVATYNGESVVATSANLGTPRGIAFDTSGNLFYADQNANYRVRRIDGSTKLVTTIGGNGTAGLSGDGGPGTSAQFLSAEGIAVDASGSVYFSDFTANRIRKLTNAGGGSYTISTFAGSLGPDNVSPLSAFTNLPQDAFADGGGNVIVSDSLAGRIRKVDSTLANIQTVAGIGYISESGDGGPVTAAGLKFPGLMVHDAAGNTYISEGSSIRKVDTSGNISTVAGSQTLTATGADGVAATSVTLQAGGLAVNSSGQLYFSDVLTNKVWTIIAGNLQTVAGTGTTGTSPDGTVATAAALNTPAGITFDSSNNLFIADSGNGLVRKVLSSNGQIFTVAGTGTAGYSGDGGLATQAQVSPNAVAVAPNGDVFIGEGNDVRLVTASTGIIETLAGTGLFGYSGDGGLARNATMGGIAGIHLDAAGRLLIADGGNNVIRRLSATSSPVVITTTSPLPAGVPATAYTTTLAATGGTGTYANWAVVSGALPPGLTLNAATGVINGTPTTASSLPYVFTVVVRDTANTFSLPVNLSIQISSYVISSVIPNTAPAGSAATGITVNGTALTGVTKVAFTTPNGPITLLTPSLVTAAQVAASVPASLLSTSGTAQVAVTDGTGVLSNQLPFTITPPNVTVTIAGMAATSINSNAPPLAPGELASVYGTNLATAVFQASSTPLSTLLGGVSVTINGVSAPLLFVSPGQINLQIPYETPTGTVNVVVNNNGVISNSFVLSIVSVAPALSPPGVQNVSGSTNSAANPATASSFVIAYFTGFGVLSPAVADGAPAGSSPFSYPVTVPTFTFNGNPISVTFAGAVPGIVGLMQVNVQIPAATASGPSTLVMTQGTASASATIYVGLPPVVIGPPANLGTFTTGSLQYGLGATGGNGTYSWSLIAGALPPGLALRTDTPSFFSANQQAGLIGVATTPGNYNFTLSVTSNASTVSQAFTMRVTALGIADNSASPPDAFLNTAYSYAFTAVGAGGPVTFSATSSAGGITLSANGVLSGTPITAGGYNLAVTLTDGIDTITRNVFLNVSTLNITTPGQLPNGTNGLPYSASLATTGGTGGYTYTASCCLPNGLSLSSAGVISGTVNSGGNNFSFQVTATDSSSHTYSKWMSITTIGAPASPLRISYGNGNYEGVDDAVVGNGYNYTVGICCGGVPPFTWSATGLPTGMFIRSGSGVTSSYVQPGNGQIFGIPQTPGNYMVQLTVTDGSGATSGASFPFHVSVLDQNPSPPSPTLNVAYSAPLRVIGGTPPYTAGQYNALPAGLTLNQANPALTGTPLENGNFWPVIGYTDSNNNTLKRTDYMFISGGSNPVNINTYQPLTFNTGSSVNYQLGACCVGSYVWSIASGSLPAGLTLSAGGLISGIPTTPGLTSVIVKAADATNVASPGYRQLQFVVTPITITTGFTLPNAIVGTAYSTTLTATGTSGTVNWSLALFNTVPPGLTLSAGGVLSGTPTVPGNYSFTVYATDASNSATASFQISVYPVTGQPPVFLTGANLGTVTTGDLQYALTAGGGNGTYTWALVSGTLPPGIALRTDTPSFFQANQQAGLIGVTTASGTYNFTLSLTSAGQTVTQPFTIRVTALNLKDTAVGLPDAFVNVPFSYAFTAVGTSGNVTFSANSSAGGLILSSNGTLSGTPTAAGNYGLGVTVTDGVDSITRFFNVTVYAVHITSAGVLPAATQNVAYNTTLTAMGGAGGYTFTSTCCLPNGLTLGTNGAITGTPTSVGPSSFSVTVTDANSVSYQENMSIVVTGVPPNLPAIGIYGNLDDAIVGDGYSRGINVCCGATAPFTWTATGLPTGMSIRSGRGIASNYVSATDAEIWGIPQAAGNYTVTITMTDASGVATSKNFPLRVSVLDQSDYQLPNGALGTAYSATARVIGGTGPYTLQQIGGQLPAGLTLNTTTFLVSGTPLEAGGFNVVLQFSDSAGHLFERTNYFNITGPSGTTIFINDNPNQGTVSTGSAYSHQFAACCVAGYTWSLAGGTLPTGTTLTTGGLLSGTVTTAGHYVFLLKAADAANVANPGFRQFTLNVSATPIFITTNSLPTGSLLSPAYSQTLTATGGSGALTWSLNQFNYLPPGLALATNGTISGTLTSAGQYSFNVTVSDTAGDSATAFYTIVVYTTGAPVSIAMGSNLGTYTIGEANIPLTANGGSGTYVWNLVSGTLPTGLALRTDTPSSFASNQQAGLMGVATVGGSYNFTLSVTSGGVTINQGFSLKITPSTLKDSFNLPDAFVNVPYSYQFTALTSAGSVTFTPNGTLPAGLGLSSSGLLTGTIATAGNVSVNVIMNDGVDNVYRNYNLLVSTVNLTTLFLPNATQSAAYNATLAASGGTGSYTYAVTSGSLPNGITMTTGGVLSGSTTFSPGKYTFIITVTDSASHSYSRRLAISVLSAPQTLPQVVPYAYFVDATYGNGYSNGISVTSGGAAPFSWTATGLPSGMDIRTGSGVTSNGVYAGDAEVFGVPTQLGDFNVTMTVTDANGLKGINTFPLHVSELVQDPSLPNGTLGTAYSKTLRVLGGIGPYTATQDGGLMPAGITLNGNTLLVSGTPIENGGYNPVFKYTDAAGHTLQRTNFFTINNVSGASTTINNVFSNSEDLGTIVVNTAYSRQLSACCAAAYSWVLTGGALPAGVTLSTGGLLTGTPTTAGFYTFVVKATDNSNSANTGIRQFTITVTPMTLTSPTALPYGDVGVAYTQNLTAAGGTGALTWVVNPFNYLPAGLTLATNGTLSGTPTVSGQYSFSLTVTDTASHIYTATYTVRIYPSGPPPLGLTFGPTVNVLRGAQRFQLAAFDGTPPYHYSLTPAATPIPGMRVQDGQPLPTSFPSTVTGGFLGVTTTVATYTSSIRVTDAANNTFDAPFTFNVLPQVLFNQSTLPKAVVGSPYSFALTAGGGSGNYTFYSATNLPPGVSMDATGTFSGTPTVAGVYNMSVTFGDNAVPTHTSITETLTVNPFAIADTAILPAGTANTAYSHTFSAPNCGTGCAWTVSSGSLPTGLSLTTAGVLSGTFTSTAGSYTSFTIQVAGSAGTVQKVFTLPIAPTARQGLSITTSITTSISVGTIPATSLTATGGAPPYNFTLQSGNLPPGISILGPGETLAATLTPGFQYLAGRALTPGTYNFTLLVTDSANNTATKAFTWQISEINIDYTSLPIAGNPLILNVTNYSQPLLVIGGSGHYTTWSNTLTPIYPGLGLNASTGLISGTPTNTGSISSNVTVTDDGGKTATQSVSINAGSNANTTITLGGPALNTTIPAGTTNTFNLSPTGGTGPYTVTATQSLPNGFLLISGNQQTSSFNAGTYDLQITPEAAGTYTFTLQAQDANGLIGARTYTIIAPAFTFPTPTTLGDGSVGTPYSANIFSFGGSPSAALQPGSVMPPGLNIQPNGVINGTPTAAGTYLFNIVISDNSGTLIVTFTLRISGITITSPLVLPTITSGIPYTYNMTATGGGSLTWTASGLPNGLSMSSAGVITGTSVSLGGRNPVTITATDGVVPVSHTFTMFVVAQNPFLFGPAVTTLNDAVVGQFYSANLIPGGGTPPYSYAFASGTLPPGMNLVSGAGLPSGAAADLTQLVGQPSTAGHYSFTLTVSDSAGNHVPANYTLNVTNLNVVAGNPHTAIEGTPYSFQFEATGGTGPYTFTASVTNVLFDIMPAGLTLSSSGLISGTPVSTGNYSFVLKVTDSANNTFSKNMTLTVTNANGLLISTTNGSVNVGQGIGVSPLTISGGNSTYTWSVGSGTPPPGITIVNGANPGFVGIPTTPGVYTFSLHAVDNANSSNAVDRTIHVTVSPEQIVSPAWNLGFSALPAAPSGTPYSYTFQVAGGTPPYTFVESPVATLPSGITLSSAGVVSGTTTDAGGDVVTPIVTDANGAQLIGPSFLFPIIPQGGKMPLYFLNTISKQGFWTGSVGAPFLNRLDRHVSVTTLPNTWSVAPSSALPPGLSILHGSNGVSDYLAGIPTQAGTFSFSLVVADSAGQTLTVPLFVTIYSIAVAPDALPPAVVGTPYTATFTFSGGTAPYTTTLDQSSDLPPGLTLSPSGVLSGTPTYPGNFIMSLVVTDGASNTFTKYFPITVDNVAGQAPALSLSPHPLVVDYPQGRVQKVVPFSVAATSGNLPFNLALEGLAGSSLTATTGTTAPGLVNLNVNAQALPQGSYFALIGASAPATVNGVDAIPVIVNVTAPQPPTADSVTPSSGTGTSQSFAFKYSSTSGSDALTQVFGLINPSLDGTNGCQFYYSKATNGIYLYDDGVSVASGPLTPGTSGTLQNSHCSIDGPTSSVSGSGNTLTVTLAITFSASYPAGAKNVYGFAFDSNNLNSGWQTLGTWTIPAAVQNPTADSVTPATGSGTSQSFAFKYSSSAGYTHLTQVFGLINGSLNGVNGCQFYYSPSSNSLFLYNDATSATVGPLTPGSAGTLQNSQCTISGTGSTVTGSGPTLTMTLAIAFSQSFGGAQNIYGFAFDSGGLNSGWQHLGTWTNPVNVPPTADSVTPNSGAGTSQNFVFKYSSLSGYTHLTQVFGLINGSLNGVNGCQFYYSPGSNSLFLYNDATSATVGPLTPGSAGTLQNSQCIISGTGSMVTGSGPTLTMTLAIAFSQSFGGAQNIYGFAFDSGGLNSGWQQLGTWTNPVNVPPTVDSVTPNSGAGTSQNFVFKYSSLAGYTHLTQVFGLINGSLNGVNGCQFYYSPSSNALFLYNDATSATVGPLTPGSSGTLQNSQCAISGTGSAVTGSGPTLTITLAIAFSQSFGGTQNIYGFAFDAAGLNSGWQNIGTWTNPVNVPPTVDSVTPNSGAGTSQNFVFKYSSLSGYTHLTQVFGLINGSLNGVNGCQFYYSPGSNSLFLYNDATSATVGPLTPGSAGTLQNSQCTISGSGSTVTGSGPTLTVTLAITFSQSFGGAQNIYGFAFDTAGLNSGWQNIGTWTNPANLPPTADSVTPNSGTGTSQNFTFKYSSVSGYGHLGPVYGLINSSLNGVNGCQFYYAPGSGIYLYTDSAGGTVGPMTPGGSGTLQNSQCIISGAGSTVGGSGNTLTMTLAITLSQSFGGTQHVYGFAFDASGLNSGWQNLGTWTNPANAPPTTDSVTPNAGAGTSQTFAFKYSSVSGYAHVSQVFGLINSSLSGFAGCQFYYSAAGNALYLFDDTVSTALGPLTPGSSNTLQNSQCTISGSGSTVTGSGNTLTMSLAISFSAAFAGTQQIYGFAFDSAGLNSGWQQIGTWTSANPATLPPTVDSVTPNSGSGSTQTFAFKYSSASGYANVGQVFGLINNSLTGVAGCQFYYSPSTNGFYLFDDAVSTALGPLTPGSAGTLQNSQCTINGTGSTVSGSGNTLTVSPAITFSGSFTNTQTVFGFAFDNGGLNSGWQVLGTWTSH